MDTTSIVIGLILLLIFIGPIGFLLVKQRSTGKVKLNRLTSFSQKHQLTLTETEILPTVSLGLDTTSTNLCVIQHTKNDQELLLDLKNFRGCETFDSNENEHSLMNSDTVEEVQLVLKGKPGTADKSIVFFNDDQDSMIAKEERLASAKRWQGKLLKLLKKQKS